MSQETKIIAGISIVTIIIVLVAAFMFGGKSQENKVAVKADEKILLRNIPHSEGSPSASVTIVEFADFQCPACGAAYPIVKQIKEEYKDKVQYIYRNFPLPMHKNAQISAQAAEAAGLQGKFFEMHDMLFENQEQWSEEPNPLDIFVSYAKKIGLDTEKFTTDVKNKASTKSIEADVSDATALGVNATPTFFINGTKYSSVLSYDEFKSAIDRELK